MKRILFPLCLSFCVFINTNLFSQDTIKYSQTCFTNQTTLVALSALPHDSIASWQWDLNNDGVFTDAVGDTIVRSFNTVTTYPVAVKITPKPGNGNPDTVTQNVIIDPLPQVNFIASNLCQGKTATYISQSTISSGNITQYKWDFNNDGSDDAIGDTATYICGPAQSYTTQLTCVSDKGCAAFSQKITTVYANPTAAFSAPDTSCLNNSAQFTNASSVTDLDFYLWNFGDGTQGTTSGNATHPYSSAGTYSVNLVAVTLYGCRDTASLPITILPLPVVSITPGGPTTFCTGNSVALSAGGPFASYSWNNGSLSQSISASASGNYSVTVADDNGCSNSASLPVVVNPLPVVYITSNGDTVLHSGSSVQLIANGADSYVWNTNDLSNNITVDSIGTYAVTGTDLNNCKASDSITVTFENSDTVSVTNNLLTPNGDGINDELNIYNVSAYSSCELIIYNMWNDKMYSVKEYKNDWKGTNDSGANLPAGSYYYIIKCDDKPLLKGNINILR